MTMSSSRLLQRVASRQLTTITRKSTTNNIATPPINHFASLIENQYRCYVSRAHPPETTPSYAIGEALAQILEGVEQRKVKRAEKWERNKVKRMAKSGVEDEGPYRNQDETIEVSINLNLDPRKPGQALRGSLSLPHGTGNKVTVVVFTNEPESIPSLKDAGATLVGGPDLIQSIASGEQPVNFDRTLATPDMMSELKKVARVLGPRGLMPNDKVGTIQPDGDKMLEAVKKQSAGVVQYRTEKNGIVQAGIGKGSFTEEALLENVKVFLNEIQNVKPDSYGKKKKGGSKKGGGKNKGSSSKAKYYLKAHLSSTQGKGVNLDLRTVDPTSSFFMAVPPE